MARGQTGPARGWVAVVAVLVFALTPIAASSEGLAFGNLTPFGCIGNSGTGPRACIGADGLDSADKIVVSPDGTSVYVTSFSGNAVVAFARNPATGGLAFNGCFQQIGTGPSSVCTRIDGLKEASGLAVSPDGRNVYATGANTGVVHVFARDAATGQLARIGCFQGTGANVAGCTSIDGLSARNVAVSPDGRNVYATGYRSVVVFVRDTATGQLIPNGCIGNSGTGPPACIGADGLDGTDEITVSPDGKSVYVTSFESNAVVEFARDTLTGNLTPIGCIGQSGKDPATCTSIDGLDGAGEIAVSPDGRSVYVTAHRRSAVVVFVRDSATSRLTPNGCIGNSGTGPPACIGADGLKGPTGVAVSPDGKNVYVASGFNDAVVMFARDTANGNLTPTGCIGQSDSGPRTCTGIDGLRAAWDLAVSPDGKYVYVVSFNSSAIVLFRRDTTASTSPPPPPASGAPVISLAKLGPAVFRAGAGTTVSYRDSLAATTTIAVVQRAVGHLSAGKCVAGAAGRKQKRCLRNVGLGSFVHNDTAGANQFRFSGRVRGRALRPGAHVLVLVPRANGKTGNAVQLPFRVTP